MQTNSSPSKTMRAAAMLFTASMFQAPLFCNFGRYYNHTKVNMTIGQF